MSTATPQTDRNIAPDLAALQQQWPRLATTPLARAEKVLALVRAGLSRRALARALEVDEGTIRRSLRLAALPAEQKLALDRGKCSVAAALRAVDSQSRADDNVRRPAPQDELLCEDKVDLILSWLAEQRIWPSWAEQLLREADRRLWLVPELASPEHAPTPEVWAAVIAHCRPSTPMPCDMEFLICWLVRWAWRLLPDRYIRAAAFARALVCVEAWRA